MKAIVRLTAQIFTYLIFAIFLAQISSSYGDTPQQLATALVKRMAPSALEIVEFELNPESTDIVISPKNNRVLITGKDARHLIVGFGYYARHIAKTHWSWNDDRMNPTTWNIPQESIHVKLPWQKVFAFNYCTLSYTAAFWGWERWQREIDLLAMNGYDHVLVQAGLEKVWQKTLSDLKYPQDKIFKFIPNPAFAAWWNMGNLEGHGGPLTQNLIDKEAELGRQICERLRQFNMTPVLQAYVGFVPHDLAQTIPNLPLIHQGGWCAFQNRPSVLDPTSPQFRDFSRIWYKHLHEVYGGKTSAYGGDLFHEGGNSNNIDITQAAQNIESAMQAASPNSSWVIQCWGHNPSQALLKGLQKDKHFLLYLDKDLHAPTSQMRDFGGSPCLWSELSNFGGNNTGLYGGLVGLSTLPDTLKNNKNNIQGVALLSEGTEQNPIYYELFHELITKSDSIDLKSWIANYVTKRYGKSSLEANRAWEELSNNVYNPQRSSEGCYEGIVCARPSWNVTKASSWGPSQSSHEIESIIIAAKHLLNAGTKDQEITHQKTYQYDLMDVTRQLISDYCLAQLQQIKLDFHTKNIKAYDKNTKMFLQALSDLDSLLASNSNTLLGTWCENAKAKGSTQAEKDLMDKAAKMQVTTWSSNISNLNDYSNRHWAGLVRSYYLPRWKIFFETQKKILDQTLTNQQAQEETKRLLNAHDLGFCTNKQSFTTKPQGNTISLAKSAINKYSALATKLTDGAKTTKGFQWNLNSGKSPLSYDVSDTVMNAGKYLVSIEYQQGASALKVHQVSLYEGDKLVAQDTHEGWTGIENKNNHYTLKLDKFRQNLDSYTIKVDVEGASSQDSQGIIQIRHQP